MTIDLYYTATSPPCQTVQLAAKAFNIDLNLKPLDMMQKKEHLKPEFLRINPQHTVPTLVDDGFSIWESRAIICYLANKYGKGSTLYPEEPKARAVVDQRLYFDIATLYSSFANFFFPTILAGKPADPALKAKVEDALGHLEKFLEGHKFAAGDNLTLADLSLVCTVSAISVTDIDFKKYANVERWFETVKKTAPGFQEVYETGMKSFKDIIASMQKK